MKNTLNIINSVKNSGVGFASLLYRSKSDESLARYTVNLGFKYINLLEKSISELQAKIDNYEFATELEKQAAGEVMASLQKSLISHQNGQQNEDYTKKGQYTSLGNGLSIHENPDGKTSLQLFGLVQSKKVIEQGLPKKQVNSKPITVAKNAIKKNLSISKFREFALDIGNIQMVKVDGQTLICE
jgi:hypothetical protein